jgi:molecular chaperone GrpE
MESVREDDPTQPSPSDETHSASPVEAGPLAELRSSLEAANAKAAEYLDGWQRARAEFANYKRRNEREQADLTQTITASVLYRILPVLDDFDLAMKSAPTEGDGARWAEGLQLVQRKFNDLLAKEGITRIEADGQPFDPNVHEAVMHVEADGQPSGHVIEVLRQGYKHGDRVLRPALVKVAK